jgi:GDP-mannose 6-dehydrogenase
MVKYVCNAFHAIKVAFANEIGTLCNEAGVDKDVVTGIYTSDTRLNISKAYLKPGFAFGGSCLPKDLRALTYQAREFDLKLPLLESIMPSNQEHIERALAAVLATEKRRIGVLGLSFKNDTDDLRESPMVHLVKKLIGEGCDVRVWDRNVSMGQLIGSNRQFIEAYIPHIGTLLTQDRQAVLDHAEVVVLGTTGIKRNDLAASLRPDQILLDVVNLQYSQRTVAKAAAV